MKRMSLAKSMRWLGAVTLSLIAAAAQAHQASTAYVDLAWQDRVVTERVDVALRDLDRDLQLDRDDDGQLSWGEVRSAWPRIAALRDQHLHWQATGARCTRQADPSPQLTRHADGVYAVLISRWDCDADLGQIRLGYDLFQHSDPDHRALLQTHGPAGEQTLALTPGDPDRSLGGPQDPSAPSSVWRGLLEMVGQGVHHILIGSDHILFLLALLLPAVLGWPGHPPARQGAAARVSVTERLSEVGWRVLKIVSAFTVAHSVTLALAAFQIVSPPSRWVESVIALSIVVAALSNLRRSGHLPGTTLAFGFGLMHGFGFANALADLALAPGAFAAQLLAFNVGVESGQLLIVAAVLPLLWAVRRHALASVWVLRGGSAVIGLMGAVWFTERALEVRLLPL